MGNNRFKMLVISIGLSFIIYIVYVYARDAYIVKQNENYTIKEYIMDQNFKEVKR